MCGCLRRPRVQHRPAIPQPMIAMRVRDRGGGGFGGEVMVVSKADRTRAERFMEIR